MTLSLKKLENLLGSKGLLPKRYFTIGGMCVYLEVLVLDSADIFFLYIPSKYDIKAPYDSSSFMISAIDVDENGTIAGDYGEELDNVQLVDVRTPEEFQAGYIAEAQNIDFMSPTFEEDIKTLDKEKPVLLYCQKGGRSAKCAEKMKDLGFKKIYDLQGGFSKWKHEGFKYVTNANVGYIAGPHRVNLFVNNLFDKKYAVAAKGDASEVLYTPAAPRTVMVNYTYQF